MRIHHSTRLPWSAGLILLALGCGKKEEVPAPAPPAPPAAVTAFRVTSVDLGKSVMADKMIATPASDFGPRDTIFASVASEGSSSGTTLTALWTFENGQVVDSSSQSIAPSGPAHTEFHIAKPSGWPPGKYKVEIRADGAVAGSKEFEVKKG